MIYHSRKPSEPLIKSEPVIFKDTGNDDDEGDEAENEKKKDKEGNGKRNSYYEGLTILSKDVSLNEVI